MAEGKVASCPQVFVVDSQAPRLQPPCRNKPTWTRAVQKAIALLVLLCLSGLAVEGYLIHKLFKKTEGLSPSASQSGVKGTVGNEESHEGLRAQPPVERQQAKPVAHLMGSGSPAGDQNVVQWSQDGEAIMKGMSYRNGRLIMEEDGVYYIYNKVQLNTAECSFIYHKVKKASPRYNIPIDLITSIITYCPNPPKHVGAKPAGRESLSHSFLAGTFNLTRGDEIYVTLESIEKLRPGHTQNYLGAFLISRP